MGLLLALLGSTCIPAAQAPSTLQLNDCRLISADASASMAARCGQLEVAENPAAPEGKHIHLYVAVIPALRLQAAPDPVFFLAGGPGQAASDAYLGIAPAFERIRRERDIVLVDQRGTGRSNRLDCDYPPDWQAAPDIETLKTLTRACVMKLPGDARFYTTSVAVGDLDKVRAALGYEHINLWGGSYGTRVAQHYARRYPQHVRAMILDGVVPPALILGPGVPIDAQAALDSVLARCAKDARCGKAFPRSKQQFDALRQRLQSPVHLQIAHPNTAKLMQMDFGNEQLALAARILSYSDATAALLPWLIDRAERLNDFQPIAAQTLLAGESLQKQLAVGMQNSVLCTEDIALLKEDTTQPKLADTYLGGQYVDYLKATCSVWPRGPMDADFHAPLHSSVPTLLLSGENDPVTPPSYGQQAAVGFTQGRHLILAGQGHLQTATGCVPQLLARFIAQPDVKQLDASCTERTAATPFMITASGSAP